MPANQLYHTWSDQIQQLCPEARKKLIHNFTWLLIGIYLSRKVHLSAIANKLPGNAKLHSTVQLAAHLGRRIALCLARCLRLTCHQERSTLLGRPCRPSGLQRLSHWLQHDRTSVGEFAVVLSRVRPLLLTNCMVASSFW